MRKLSALVFVAFLSGCASPISTTGSVSLVTAEKSLAVAHYAYQGIGQTILTATQQGLLRGANATKVKSIYDKIGASLDVADKADDAANAGNIIAAVSAIADEVTQIKALLGSK